MNTNRILREKLNRIESEATSLVQINENKLKESNDKHASLKSEINSAAMQMFNRIFEEQVALNDKSDQLATEFKLKSDQLMNERTLMLNEVKRLNATAQFHDPNRLDQIESEIDHIGDKITQLKNELNHLDRCQHCFRRDDVFCSQKLGYLIVSF